MQFTCRLLNNCKYITSSIIYKSNYSNYKENINCTYGVFCSWTSLILEEHTYRRGYVSDSSTGWQLRQFQSSMYTAIAKLSFS